MPLIETSHYQYLQVLILAKALQARGAQVKVLLCGQSLTGCEIKSVRRESSRDVCFKCRFNERRVLPLFGLECLRIRDVLSEGELDHFSAEASRLVAAGEGRTVRHGVDLKQFIDDSVVRYFYGRVPQDAEKVRRVREEHTKTALMSIEVARRLDTTWSPQIVLLNMTSYSAWGPYFKYYHSRGNRVRQVSLSQLEFRSLVFNSFDLFPGAGRFLAYLKSRNHRLLESGEREQLDEFMGRRHTGDAQIFVRSNYFRRDVSAGTLRQKLTLDEDKRNVFLFSNVYWDVGLSDRPGLYADVISWVLDTIELLRGEKNCHLYIKPHPAEVFDSSSSLKGISEIIKERYPELPGNVTIIEPEWQLRPYDFFPFIDVGVIFNGTLGLEMIRGGIPVISTGLTAYQGLGFALEPDTVGSYRSALVGELPPPEVNREMLDLFAYFYFIRTLIPWRLTKTAYGNADFDGFEIRSLDDLEPGHDPFLDHLCNCIFDLENSVIEGWPAEPDRAGDRSQRKTDCVGNAE